MIRVLIVEDSAVIREFLVHILSSDPEVEVIGTAENGEQALAAVAQTKPDVITMDVHMPRMNGFDATRRIMETRPTPIVIVSGTLDITEATHAFRAMEAGALAVLQRPAGIGDPDHEVSAADLIRTVKLMAEVKVVRRWTRSRPPDVIPAGSLPVEVRVPAGEIAVVAMGASTGGPPALQSILSRLPKRFPVPVLVVQHTAAGFTDGFVEWLAQSSNLPVHVPTQGEHILPGHAYVAPEGFHMQVRIDGRIWLSMEEPENGLRPSVSSLFRSVAKVYGKKAIGVLLTGMGKDGARELKLMKEQGAVTIAQDRESSVVHGMPGEAIALGAAAYVLSPEEIALALTSLVGAGSPEQSMRST
ncbi:MAG TPA: chemotaxis response regulator protein-glutamate methylesterase [Terriglobia bacterium]|nr:chemotaxis response regulator protein-glutamate methylesterase [Terriglobia bacterium]